MKLILLIIGISVLIHQTVAAIRWNGNWAHGCDWNGRNIGNKRVPGSQCSNACEKQPGCTHYTWTTYNGGTCWMKTGTVAKENAIENTDKTLVCGLLSGGSSAIVWNGNWAFNCDWNGGDIANVRVPGADCSNSCERQPGCTHYTWTTYNGGTCWMKRGSVTKDNAIPKSDKTVVCGLLASTRPEPPGPPGPPGNDVEFRVINKCPYTIWPGIDGNKRSDRNWRVPFNGGWELGSGQTTTFRLPKDFDSGRIWGRTNCRQVNNQFQCDSGSCGFKECAFDGVKRGGATPATLAEFTLNGWGNKDYYDVSLVDGYNLKIQIFPRNPNSDEPGNQYWCKNLGCLSDLNAICPQELKKYNAQGSVVGCLSACEKFQTDEYCCRGRFNIPQTCVANRWPVNYPAVFKQACPIAYSYAYDDRTSTFFCRNTGYDVVFC